MLNKLKVNLLLVFIITCVFLYGEQEKAVSVKTSEKSDSQVLDITKVENSIDQLKKTMEIMPADTNRQNVKLKRDPFVSLVLPESGRKEAADATAGVSRNGSELIVSGIIFDRKSPIAIIGTEVKKEGEFIGEYEVLKIMEDKVLLKHGESILPIDIQK